MDQIGGLPAHILLIHAVVVFGPLAGIGAIAYAVIPRFRERLAWPLGMLSLLLAPLSVVAAEAGEKLEASVPQSPLIRTHAEQGDLFKTVAVLFFIVVALMLAATHRPLASRMPPIATIQGWTGLRIVLLIAGALAGTFLIYQSILTGHSGSASVWTR